ncbi:MAG: hypothetical protein ACRD3S_05605 [Terracidiphilus sp.]
MKQFSRIALIAAGFGLLAILLLASLSRPAKADDGWAPSKGPMWTHLGVRQGNLVDLNCVAFSSEICTQYDLIAKDGSATVFTGPPKGFSLLVTDVSWQSTGNTPGELEGVTLLNQGGLLHLFTNDEIASAGGAATGNIHFTAGVVYSGVPNIIVNTANPQLQVIGYYVAN